MLLGRDIGMFQDIYDIRTGDDWENVLRSQLTGASFMVPVLTPRYFTRKWCREEVITFLRLAEEAGHQPLLFPIYFVQDRALDRGEMCEVREAVMRYQYFDYRPLRFESDPTRMEQAIHDFANDVVDKLESDAPLPAANARPAERPASKSVANPSAKRMEPDPDPVPVSPVAEAAEAPAPAPKAPAPKAPATPAREIPTLIVDPWPNLGDHTTIAAAIKAAEPGSRVLIRPGTYEENLILDKPLELIGEGEAADVIVRTTKRDAMTVSANIAEIANLTLLRDAGEGNHVALWVTDGRATFHDCVFTSKSISAVEVRGAGTAPEFRRCRFIDNAQAGVLVKEHARPRIEDCELTGNGYQAVAILTGADPILRRCVLGGNTQTGCLVEQNGRGLLEDCTIRENGSAGVVTRKGGAPVVRRCTITENTDEAVWLSDADGGGTFEDNDLRGNKRGPWLITEGAEKNLIRRNNKE